MEIPDFIDIRLNSDNKTLDDEVVIVGSGTQKKVRVAEAVSTVKGLELKTPTPLLTNFILLNRTC